MHPRYSHKQIKPGGMARVALLMLMLMLAQCAECTHKVRLAHDVPPAEEQHQHCCSNVPCPSPPLPPPPLTLAGVASRLVLDPVRLLSRHQCPAKTRKRARPGCQGLYFAAQRILYCTLLLGLLLGGLITDPPSTPRSNSQHAGRVLGCTGQGAVITSITSFPCPPHARPSSPCRRGGGRLRRLDPGIQSPETLPSYHQQSLTLPPPDSLPLFPSHHALLCSALLASPSLVSACFACLRLHVESTLNFEHTDSAVCCIRKTRVALLSSIAFSPSCQSPTPICSAQTVLRTNIWRARPRPHPREPAKKVISTPRKSSESTAADLDFFDF